MLATWEFCKTSSVVQTEMMLLPGIKEKSTIEVRLQVCCCKWSQSVASVIKSMTQLHMYSCSSVQDPQQELMLRHVLPKRLAMVCDLGDTLQQVDNLQHRSGAYDVSMVYVTESKGCFKNTNIP